MLRYTSEKLDLDNSRHVVGHAISLDFILFYFFRNWRGVFFSYYTFALEGFCFKFWLSCLVYSH